MCQSVSVHALAVYIFTLYCSWVSISFLFIPMVTKDLKKPFFSHNSSGKKSVTHPAGYKIKFIPQTGSVKIEQVLTFFFRNNMYIILS